MAATSTIDFLVLAHLGDDCALQVAAALAKRNGARSVKLISAEELVLAPRWLHVQESRSGPGLNTRTSIELGDGCLLCSDRIGVVFNRLRAVPMPHFANATGADREYAVMEMYALLLSWVFSLPCPVFNRPTGRGLGGPERSLPEWLALAAKAGLPVHTYRFTSDPRRFRTRHAVPVREPVAGLSTTTDCVQRVVVAGETFSCRPPIDAAYALYRLRDSSGCDLLQVDFAPCEETGEWKVAGASSFPEVGGAREVLAIVKMLEMADCKAAAV